jgi:hypothetical protein
MGSPERSCADDGRGCRSRRSMTRDPNRRPRDVPPGSGPGRDRQDCTATRARRHHMASSSTAHGHGPVSRLVVVRWGRLQAVFDSYVVLVALMAKCPPRSGPAGWSPPAASARGQRCESARSCMEKWWAPRTTFAWTTGQRRRRRPWYGGPWFQEEQTIPPSRDRTAAGSRPARGGPRPRGLIAWAPRTHPAGRHSPAWPPTGSTGY